MKQCLLLITCLAAAMLPLDGAEIAPAPDFKGRLARAFFLEPDVARALAAVDLTLAGEERQRLTEAAGRAADPRLDAAPEGKHRERLVRGMVAFTPGDHVVVVAIAALGDAPIGPPVPADATVATSEAQWAEAYLKEHRDSPLTPYLYGFLMTRHRLAYEYATRAGDIEARKAAARKYRAFLLRARARTETLARWVAEDIDRMPHIEVAAGIHPRDYDPDACCNGRKGD